MESLLLDAARDDENGMRIRRLGSGTGCFSAGRAAFSSTVLVAALPLSASFRKQSLGPCAPLMLNLIVHCIERSHMLPIIIVNNQRLILEIYKK